MKYLTNSEVLKAAQMLQTESLEVVAKYLNVAQGVVSRYLPELADSAKLRNQAKQSPKYVLKLELVEIMRRVTGLKLVGLENAPYTTIAELFSAWVIITKAKHKE